MSWSTQSKAALKSSNASNPGLFPCYSALGLVSEITASPIACLHVSISSNVEECWQNVYPYRKSLVRCRWFSTAQKCCVREWYHILWLLCSSNQAILLLTSASSIDILGQLLLVKAHHHSTCQSLNQVTLWWCSAYRQTSRGVGFTFHGRWYMSLLVPWIVC